MSYPARRWSEERVLADDRKWEKQPRSRKGTNKETCRAGSRHPTAALGLPRNTPALCHKEAATPERRRGERPAGGPHEGAWNAVQSASRKGCGGGGRR